MVFAVEIDGVHVCHLGDLGHLLTDEQLTELGPVDVLLVPVGGETTLTPAEAAEVVAQIGPKIVIPMHYGVDGASNDLGGPDKFLHEMAAEPIRQPKAQVTVSSLPDETQVVVLEARGRTS
jgi:L-ascorbate metabolism protein UlaG (beta-lactamase superfamily)